MSKERNEEVMRMYLTKVLGERRFELIPSFVAPDMVEELGAPGAHGDDVHKDVSPEFAPVQEMGTKCCRAPEVMCCDAGAVELPVVSHLGEHPPLDVEGGALPLAHVGTPETRHVVPVDAETLGEPRDDAVP